MLGSNHGLVFQFRFRNCVSLIRFATFLQPQVWRRRKLSWNKDLETTIPFNQPIRTVHQTAFHQFLFPQIHRLYIAIHPLRPPPQNHQSSQFSNCIFVNAILLTFFFSQESHQQYCHFNFANAFVGCLRPKGDKKRLSYILGRLLFLN